MAKYLVNMYLRVFGKTDDLTQKSVSLEEEDIKQNVSNIH